MDEGPFKIKVLKVNQIKFSEIKRPFKEVE